MKILDILNKKYIIRLNQYLKIMKNFFKKLSNLHLLILVVCIIFSVIDFYGREIIIEEILISVSMYLLAFIFYFILLKQDKVSDSYSKDLTQQIKEIKEHLESQKKGINSIVKSMIEANNEHMASQRSKN